MTVRKFVEKYRTRGPSLVVGEVIGRLKAGQTLAPEQDALVAELLLDLRHALEDEVYRNSVEGHDS